MNGKLHTKNIMGLIVALVICLCMSQIKFNFEHIWNVLFKVLI